MANIPTKMEPVVNAVIKGIPILRCLILRTVPLAAGGGCCCCCFLMLLFFCLVWTLPLILLLTLLLLLPCPVGPSLPLPLPCTVPKEFLRATVDPANANAGAPATAVVDIALFFPPIPRIRRHCRTPQETTMKESEHRKWSYMTSKRIWPEWDPPLQRTRIETTLDV